MGAGAAGVDDALRDAFVIEMSDLLPQDEILDQGGSALSALQGVLIVRNGRALVGGKGALEGRDDLMGLAAFPGMERRRFVARVVGCSF
jgi:hypothetical protein